MTNKHSSITPQKLHAVLQKQDGTAILDVRSQPEYRAGHIPGAKSIPIEELNLEALQQRFQRQGLGDTETVYLTCQAGPRAEKAAQQLQLAGLQNLQLVHGGTQAWEQAGLPLRRCGSAISLERQVQIAIGVLLLTKVWLGFSVHELFFAVTALIGTGLIVAGATSWCGLGRLLARMPWNRRSDCFEQAGA